MDLIATDLTVEDYRITIGILFVATVIGLYYVVRNWKRLRLIENTPTARLRSAHQGYVELIGKGHGVADQSIYAPLSNHPCLWFCSQIDRQETVTENGRTQIRWNVVYRYTSDHHFQLIDDEASCWVDPSGAEINGIETLVWYGNTEWPTRTRILESQSIVHSMKNNFRYREQLILPGQSLYVLGQFKTSSAAAHSSVHRVMIDVINAWKQDQPALKARFDTNHDGKIDQAEWEVARQQAQAEARKIYQQRALEPNHNIITKPDDKKRPFIISVYSQATLTGHYRRNVHWSMAWCAFIASIAIWLVHARDLAVQ